MTDAPNSNDVTSGGGGDNATSGVPSSAAVDNTTSPSTSGTLSLMQPLVDFEEISFKEKVGHGSYGVVYKAVWHDRFVAVKEFGASAEQKAIETEVKQLSRVRHHNIIALFGISAKQQSIYLIMEYAEGGSLHNFLHGNVKPYYATAHAISWARQCAEGVAYLHAMKPKPLIHRDLKPLNLLLNDKGRHLKICDFGTVVDKSTWMTNNKGSAAWMAPEVFEGSKYTEKCDIFSWGIVLWEVLSRQQPFKEIDNTYSIMWKIHLGDRPPPIKDCPELIQNLMTSCWAKMPELRPSMQYVVSIMNQLAASFPGAEEALEYEFVNQQIIRHDTGNDSANNYTLDFSSYTSSGGNNNSTSYTTQITPTNSHSNTSSTPTPTNIIGDTTDIFNPHSNVPTAAITASTRWDVIPEESETSVFVRQGSSDAFNLNPSAAATKRLETIRNGMTQMANMGVAPLSIHVDPNAWDLNRSDSANSFAKSDGKERLTVTDAKPMMPQGPMANNVPAEDAELDDDEDDDEENDDTESLTDMLDPELQPEQPIADNPQSQAIYHEHRRLAKEHLRVVTKLYYAQDFKEKLLQQMEPAERQEKQELLKKMSEKEELLELYNNLKQQLEKVRAGQPEAAAVLPANTSAFAATAHSQLNHDTSVGAVPTEIVADDGWVVVAPNQNA